MMILGLCSLASACNRVVIDLFGVRVDRVMDGFEQLAGAVDR